MIPIQTNTLGVKVVGPFFRWSFWRRGQKRRKKVANERSSERDHFTVEMAKSECGIHFRFNSIRVRFPFKLNMRLLFLVVLLMVQHHGDIHYERNCSEDRCPGGLVDRLVDRSRCLVLAWGSQRRWCLVMGLDRFLSSSSFCGFETRSWSVSQSNSKLTRLRFCVYGWGSVKCWTLVPISKSDDGCTFDEIVWNLSVLKIRRKTISHRS